MAPTSKMIAILMALCSLALAQDVDIGPETCGKDRTSLADWFKEHGSAGLLLDPRPPHVEIIDPDPYLDPSNPPPADPEAKKASICSFTDYNFARCNFLGYNSFCGVQWSETEVDAETGNMFYTLSNFDTEADLKEANFEVTHEGHCGACSTMQDLGVYLAQNLTDPVARCSAIGFISPELERQCMENLGFSDECISIWIHNMHNTRRECLLVCIKSLLAGEEPNNPDGSYNDCIQCDEDKSGPNFKFFRSCSYSAIEY